nr:MAG TPA: hypothetical protein [Caudoviricetes sp.]
MAPHLFLKCPGLLVDSGGTVGHAIAREIFLGP